jgi:hypothetical protein
MTEKEVLFNSVFWNSIVIWTVISLLGTALLSLVGFTRAKQLGFAAIAFGLAVIIVGGPIKAYSNANAATHEDWEQAIDDKSTYFEKLHGIWVRYDVEVHTCTYQDNDTNTNDTGCRYVTVDSYCDSYDDEGDCDDTDYKFYPWFTQEETLTGELNVFKKGHVVFASHLAPENWREYEWNLPFGVDAGVDFQYERNPEWLRVKNAIDNGQILPGSVWNTYFNWLYADDYTIIREYSPHIPGYLQAGLLPTINMVHDSQGREVTIDIRGNVTGVGFDYDIVQFLGGLNPSPETYDGWQNTAHLWGAMAGPQIQSSLIIFFAPASRIDNPYQWIHASKAYLMTEESDDGYGFGRYILPKNVVLIGCAVSDDMQTVEWCRAETGIFKGNERFKQDMENLSPFPFTPSSTFGNMTAAFEKDAVGNPVWEDPDWDDRQLALMVPRVEFATGMVDGIIRDPREGHGFHRVEMEEFANKRAVIDPDEEQIQAIKSSKRWSTFSTVGTIWLLVFLGLGYATHQSSKRR